MQQNTITDTKETEEGFKYYAKTRTVGRFNNLKGGSCTIVTPTRLKTYLPKSGWGPYVGPRGPVGGGGDQPPCHLFRFRRPCRLKTLHSKILLGNI